MSLLNFQFGCRAASWRIFAAVFAFAIAFAADAVAENRALIISLDSYADPKLSGSPSGLAKNDAASIRKLLIEKLGYKPRQIKTLRNKQATKAAILTAIAKWLGPVPPGAAGPKKLKGLDESGTLKKKQTGKKKRRARKKKRKPRSRTFRSYLYYSGLGYVQRDTDGDERDGLDETIIPFDARVSEIGGVDQISGMISDDELSEAIGKFTGRHTTLVFDTSHAAPPARGEGSAGEEILRLRSPRLNSAAAKISESPAGAPQRGEGGLVETAIKRGSLTLWSAASAGQTALIAGEDSVPRGLFTLLYVEGLMEGKADANANGIISNAELLRHVMDGSSAYCRASRHRCKLGLRPRLDPADAFGRTAWVNRKKVTRARERRLSVTRLADFLGARTQTDFELKQIPPSPLKVGISDIRYQLLSPSRGYLVLLNLTARGELFQLYPNQYAGKDENGFGGQLKANVPLLVPEDSYGVRLSATVPEKGHIVAIVTADPVRFDASVTDRSIASISADEAIPVYLARLAAALHAPSGIRSEKSKSGPVRWSVVTLPYEILPYEITP